MDLNFKVEAVQFDGEPLDHCDSRKCVDFKSGDDVLRLQLFGECCSESYFEANSVEDLKALVGETIVKIEKVESAIPEKGGGDIDSLTRYSALKITTNKQSITVDWRNESNGYYSGWCTLYLNGNRIDE